jgi:hypothetical protein
LRRVSYLPQGLWTTLKRLFSIDVRSLAAFRIGLGVLIALDLLARFPLIEALYTDRGLAPRSLMTFGPLSRTPLDLYRFDGSYAWAAGWIGLTFLCSVLLAIGFRTRWVTVALWVLMSALFRRNQIATDGGDSIVRSFLLWSMFLPLGACWSVDARHRETTPSIACSPATAALLLQPALLYFIAGMVKDTPAWRDGHAVLLALHDTEWVRPLGVWLSEHERLVRVMTFGTRVVEIGAPLLLFLPILTQRARAVAISLLVALQVGLATSLRLNFFPFYSSVGWLAFVPTCWWNRFSAGGELSNCPAPSDRAHPWETLLLRIADAVVICALCIGTVVGFVRTDKPSLVARTAIALGFAQRWNMYRNVGDDCVRIHVVGALANGATVDLRTYQGHQIDSPLEDWARSYRADLLLEAMRGGDCKLLRAFARFVCGRWNGGAARESELTALTFTTRVIWQYVPREVPEVVRREPCDQRR